MTPKELAEQVINGELVNAPFSELAGKQITLAETSSCNAINFQTNDGEIYCIEGENGILGIPCPVLKKVKQKEDTYEFTVTFQRSLSDDLEVIEEKFPNMKRKDALLQQFREELQSAYDNNDIAGTFQIVKGP